MAFSVFLVYLLFFSAPGGGNSFRDRQGEQLPIFDSLVWIKGEELFKKNLPTVIVGFEQWCPGCLISISANNNFFKDNSTRYNVLGITTENDDGLRELVNTKIDYPVAQDSQGALHAFFENNAIPFYVVVDSSFHVLYQGHDFPGDKALR